MISRKDSLTHWPLSINVAHHCPLMRHITIKEKTTEVKGTQKYSTKSVSTIFSLESFSLTDLSIEGGLADATPTHYSSTQFILQVFHLQRRSHSQHYPSATTRSSTVVFLHHQQQCCYIAYYDPTKLVTW